MKSGWQHKHLGDVCEVIGGGTPSKDKAHAKYYSGDIPWATVRDMKHDLLSDTEFKITQEAVKQSSTNIIPKGNVVIATRVGLGKVCLLDHDTAINQDLRGVIPKDRGTIDVQFLFWWFKAVAPLIIGEGTGATVQGVKLPFIKSLQIPTPPFTEQQRIVAILDDAFASIATAVSNAEKNLSNTRDVFRCTLRTIFSTGGVDWIQTTVGDQVTLQRGFDITKNVQRLGGVPVVSSGGIKSYHDSAKANGPGVVIGRKGTLGKVFYLSDEYWPHDTTLWVKDFKGNLPRFVYYFFMNLDVAHLDTGTANPALNRNLIHPICLTWPPLKQQVRLTEMFDQISMGTQRLEIVYQQKLDALAELKKSILHQAFTGQLH